MPRLILKLCAIAFFASFAGCATRDAGARSVTVEAVQEMRDAVTRGDGIISVNPLPDAQVAALIRSAHDAQQKGDISKSRTLLERARLLAPANPLIEQEFAELQLLEGDLEDARQAALRSYEAGPGIGPLCQRNWLTVAWVLDINGEADASADALSDADRCVLKQKPRL